jgi:hypothetical protein
MGPADRSGRAAHDGAPLVVTSAMTWRRARRRLMGRLERDQQPFDPFTPAGGRPEGYLREADSLFALGE